MPGAAPSEVPVLEEPPSLLPELLEMGTAGQGDALQERIEELPKGRLWESLAVGARPPGKKLHNLEVFAQVSPDDLSTLRAKVSDPQDADHAAAQRVGGHGEEVGIGKGGVRASAFGEEMINNADGDAAQPQKYGPTWVNVLIRKTLRSPLPLLMVLQLNIAEASSESDFKAQQQGDGDKLRVMMHISTVMQEELEKKASRVKAMLNKLLRIEDENIRNNILRDQLTPVEVAGAPDLDGSGGQLMAAQVPWERLAPAIESLVKDVDRQMVAVLGPDDNARYETMDRIREVAKQARLIIGVAGPAAFVERAEEMLAIAKIALSRERCVEDVYGQGPMDQFSADLTRLCCNGPAFHTLMTYKARGRRSPEGEEGAEEAAEAPRQLTGQIFGVSGVAVIWDLQRGIGSSLRCFAFAPEVSEVEEVAFQKATDRQPHRCKFLKADDDENDDAFDDDAADDDDDDDYDDDYDDGYRHFACFPTWLALLAVIMVRVITMTIKSSQPSSLAASFVVRGIVVNVLLKVVVVRALPTGEGPGQGCQFNPSPVLVAGSALHGWWLSAADFGFVDSPQACEVQRGAKSKAKEEPEESGGFSLDPPSGTRDFFPEDSLRSSRSADRMALDMRVQRWLFDRFRETARLYGFEEYDAVSSV
ncbi:unnamed protein product [Symbiodinium microadriaticum]|nr:unnamed protein product [Symbiodinium microadriaticum]